MMRSMRHSTHASSTMLMAAKIASSIHAVVKESIIADFLKSRGKYMHQETTDEFRIAEGNLTFWISRLFTSC